jgi:hypothetical protein
MLRVIMSVSAEGAGNYFDVALKKSDYYAKEPGVWAGKGAERLGLRGEVTREDFLALASNEVPGMGAKLAVRTKTSGLRATIFVIRFQSRSRSTWR